MTAIIEINAEELDEALKQDTVKLIDVREGIENAEEKIENSILLPLSSFKATEALSHAENRKIVLYCRSGKRSQQAAHKLIEIGCTEIYCLKGGIEDWKAKGFYTIKSSKGPISLMRQVQITAGSLVVIGVILSYVVAKEFILLSGFVGAGLVFAGVTNTCGLAMLVAKMPWNQSSASISSCER